jgi:hypothetical protein
MKRNENESFADYKTRRAGVQNAERLAKKQIQGGVQSSRQLARHPAPIMVHGKLIQPKPIRGNYGKDIMAALARKNATPGRLARHQEYVRSMKSRKECLQFGGFAIA